MYLIVKKRSTYLISLPKGFKGCFIFYDFKGRIYYSREIGNFDKIEVNFVRGGTFKSNVDFKVLKIGRIKIKEPSFELPKQERKRFKPITILKVIGKSKITGKSFTSPARIFTQLGVVETGEKFNNYSQPTKTFILLHELGHFFYETEWKCDLFAYYHFINLGYNDSQAFYSLSKILRMTRKDAKGKEVENEENIDRTMRLFNTINTHEKK